MFWTQWCPLQRGSTPYTTLYSVYRMGVSNEWDGDVVYHSRHQVHFISVEYWSNNYCMNIHNTKNQITSSAHITITATYVLWSLPPVITLRVYKGAQRPMNTFSYSRETGEQTLWCLSVSNSPSMAQGLCWHCVSTAVNLHGPWEVTVLVTMHTLSSFHFNWMWSRESVFVSSLLRCIMLILS